jgi:hypothetical protein
MTIKATILTLIILFINLDVFPKAVTYGDLYLVEEEQSYRHEGYISYLSELDNSFENVSGVVVNYNYFMTGSILIGAKYGTYSTSTTDSGKLFNGTSVKTIGPKSSYSAVLSWIPLNGHINFLSMASLPFDITLNGNYGRYQYDNKEGYYVDDGDFYSFGIRLSSLVYKNWLLNLEISHALRTQKESFDTSVNLFNVGIGYRW